MSERDSRTHPLRALVCSDYGGEERLRIELRQRRRCREGRIRIRAHASSVNFADTLIIRGNYQYKPELPFVPGHEVAGEILEVGAGVRGFHAGDRVIALTGSGAFQDEVVIQPSLQQMHRIPDEMSWIDAAGFTLSFGTAIHALRQRGALWHGETLLVLGAAGGTGSAAVQVGKALGAEVIAAASGPEKCRFVQGLGADHVVDTGAGPLPDQVYQLTQGRGVPLVFDPVGGKLFHEAIRCLAWNGRLLVVGFAGGEIPSLPMHRSVMRGISVIGVAFAMSAIQDPARNADDFAWLFDAYQRGIIRPRIDSVFPLEKAADALTQVREGRALGKVVVDNDC